MTCRAGARWVQEEILAKQPNAKVRVYVVWLVALGGDRRSTWDPESMSDPRVLHFWDADRFAGAWFAKHIDGADGYMWDTYLLYGPKARWDSAPAPLISSGASVIDQGAQLRDALLPLISP